MTLDELKKIPSSKTMQHIACGLCRIKKSPLTSAVVRTGIRAGMQRTLQTAGTFRKKNKGASQCYI
jgi:hypothetical protein